MQDNPKRHPFTVRQKVAGGAANGPRFPKGSNAKRLSLVKAAGVTKKVGGDRLSHR